ncbi:MAG: tetratricopeptide repeat protein [Planctomycetaceae bacterium]|nr:tetratricopeptide repeat protein [Planctomycetaceae bacterium]
MSTSSNNPEATESRSRGSRGGLDRREWPMRQNLVKPGNWFHWCMGLAECWLFSRRRNLFLKGFPFLFVVVTFPPLVSWVRNAPVDEMVQKLEKAVNKAIRDGNTERHENYLTAIYSLRPGNPEYRFRLGQYLVQNGKVQQGLAHVRELCPEDKEGYPPARMWLVLQSMQPTPAVQLTRDEILLQLTRVIRLQPDNLEANRILAILYTEKQEYSLAERHLATASRKDPTLLLELARLQRLRGRDETDIQQTTARAVDVLQERLGQSRQSDETRLALADAYALSGRIDEAREVLNSGRRLADTPVLRRGLARLNLGQLTTHIRASFMNWESGAQQLKEVLTLDPVNAEAVALLAQLAEFGVSVPRTGYDESISAFRAAIEADPDNVQKRLLLSTVLSLAGEFEQAIDVQKPLLETNPNLRIGHLKLLTQAGKSTEADQLATELLTETQNLYTGNPRDLPAILLHSEVLVVQKRADEAMQFLRERITAFESQPQQPATDPPGTPEAASANPTNSLTDEQAIAGLQELYGRTCLIQYERLVPAGSDPSASDATADELIRLLEAAVQTRAVSTIAADRLASLRYSSHAASESAAGLLNTMIASSRVSADILNIVASRALTAEDYKTARASLEQVYSYLRGRQNPMVYNNLAIVLVRDENPDPERALELVNAALKIVPDNADLIATHGEVLLALGKPDEAYGLLLQAKERRPDNTEILELLKRICTDKGDTGLAEEFEKQIQRIQSQDKESTDTGALRNGPDRASLGILAGR